ncbi:MAG: DUF423 domain-containing protein [Alphaproteobacteria bacterium]|nr:DUF423 domain-containing protein [Alphaproteobacteria bacterium]
MTWWRVAGICGALGVGIGAFGAHGLEQTIDPEHIERWWNTGARYHLLHSVALLGVAAHPGAATGALAPRVAGWAFVVGIALFSGSLYVMTLTGITKLGMITPLGGLAFIAGWVALALSGGAPASSGEEA